MDYISKIIYHEFLSFFLVLDSKIEVMQNGNLLFTFMAI